jgi:hypothetical protein
MTSSGHRWYGLRSTNTLRHVGPQAPDARDTPAVPAEVYRDAEAILDSALRGDRDGVVGRFEAAVSRGGLRSAYDVACCLAATIVGDPAPPGFAALDYPDIERARYDARWVARFVSAYANADTPTGEALFGAAIADGQLAECLTTLAGSTVATLRRRDTGR